MNLEDFRPCLILLDRVATSSDAIQRLDELVDAFLVQISQVLVLDQAREFVSPVQMLAQIPKKLRFAHLLLSMD